MGKYIRKSKTAREVSVMEVSHSYLGVRTRAKTLALQRLQKSSSPVAAPPVGGGEGSYLQLRSRRLEKPPLLVAIAHRRKKQTQPSVRNPNPSDQNSDSSVLARSRPRQGRTKSTSRSVAMERKEGEWSSGNEKEMAKDETVRSERRLSTESNKDLGVEASFGENGLVIEERERESICYNLIRNSEDTRTPGSATNPNGSINTDDREENLSVRRIPTPNEMDEFFADAEEEQQKLFIKKYNFDPVNEKPLPGRFEWEKVNH